ASPRCARSVHPWTPEAQGRAVTALTGLRGWTTLASDPACAGELEDAMPERAGRKSAVTVLILALAGLMGSPAGGGGPAAATPPRVLIVGPLDGYGALVAGVSEGLQAGGFGSTADVQLEVQSVSSMDEAKTAIAAAAGRGLDAVVTVFGQATQAARDGAP